MSVDDHSLNSGRQFKKHLNGEWDWMLCKRRIAQQLRDCPGCHNSLFRLYGEVVEASNRELYCSLDCLQSTILNPERHRMRKPKKKKKKVRPHKWAFETGLTQAQFRMIQQEEEAYRRRIDESERRRQGHCSCPVRKIGDDCRTIHGEKCEKTADAKFDEQQQRGHALFFFHQSLESWGAR